MRRRIAQLLAAVTGIAILLLALLFAYVQHQRLPIPSRRVTDTAAPGHTPPAAPGRTRDDGPPPAPGEPAMSRGRQVYLEQACAACHSIAGVGNRRAPLDDVGARLSRDTIRRWIVDPQSIDPDVRKPAYHDLAEEDLEALVAYLVTLREATAH